MTTRWPSCVVFLSSLLVWASGAAWAGPTDDAKKKPFNLKTPATFRATLDPVDLAPGAKGHVVLEVTLGDESIHIKQENLRVQESEQEGLTVDTKSVVTIPEAVRHDDEWGGTYYIHTGTFQVRIPVAVAEDFPSDGILAIGLKYGQCNKFGCGPLMPATIKVPLLGAGGGADVEQVANVPGGSFKVSARKLADPDRIVVRWEPSFGVHGYLPPKGDVGLPISAEGQADAGVTWSDFDYPEGEQFHEPVEVSIPFTATKDAKQLRVRATWQGCTASGCQAPGRHEFVWPLAGAATVETQTGDDTPVGVVVLPTIEGEGLTTSEAQSSNFIKERIEKNGLLLTLLFVFSIGAGLTFTPCVFPIIPLVVATIAGGQAIARKRLLTLLGVYVLGLSLAFATIGVIAALTGGSMSAAFQSPYFIGGMSLFFIVMAFGMIGLFELQPPQWLMKLQGGAQQKGGSVLGAFLLGVLGAVLASPCTGPVIVAMAAATATTGDTVLGFILFFVFGLGMGAIIALFGSVNMALRPGPWMVWVRYIFGVLLFGGAMWYLASNGLAPQWVIAVFGVAIIALAVFLLARHLQHKEGESPARARAQSLKVGVLKLAALALVLFLTRPAGGIGWDKLTSVDQLIAAVKDANAAGKPVVVDFWANWCAKCKEYDHVFAGDDDLQAKLAQVVRLKVDQTDKNFPELRDALGVPRGQSPLLVFIDTQGRIVTKATTGWPDGDAELAGNWVRARLDYILAESP